MLAAFFAGNRGLPLPPQGSAKTQELRAAIKDQEEEKVAGLLQDPTVDMDDPVSDPFVYAVRYAQGERGQRIVQLFLDKPRFKPSFGTIISSVVQSFLKDPSLARLILTDHRVSIQDLGSLLHSYKHYIADLTGLLREKGLAEEVAWFSSLPLLLKASRKLPHPSKEAPSGLISMSSEASPLVRKSFKSQAWRRRRQVVCAYYVPRRRALAKAKAEEEAESEAEEEDAEDEDSTVEK
jgi:hypothetical protein